MRNPVNLAAQDHPEWRILAHLGDALGRQRASHKLALHVGGPLSAKWANSLAPEREALGPNNRPGAQGGWVEARWQGVLEGSAGVASQPRLQSYNVEFGGHGRVL